MSKYQILYTLNMYSLLYVNLVRKTVKKKTQAYYSHTAWKLKKNLKSIQRGKTQIVYFKYVQFIVCQLYFNKAVKNKEINFEKLSL